MIQNRKAELIADFQLGTLHLRKMELRFYLENWERIAMVASLFVGFTSDLLVTGVHDDRPHVLWSSTTIQTMFHCCTATALGSLSLALIIATVGTMWGPSRLVFGHTTTDVGVSTQLLDFCFTASFRLMELGFFLMVACFGCVFWTTFPILTGGTCLAICAFGYAATVHDMRSLAKALDEDGRSGVIGTMPTSTFL